MPRKLRAGTLSRSRKDLERSKESPPLHYQPPYEKKGAAFPHPDYRPPTPTKKKEAAPFDPHRTNRPPPPEAPQESYRGLDLASIASIAAARVEHSLDRAEITLRDRIRKCLPPPHSKQQEIIDSTAKRKVINCGRRVGKTTVACREGIDKASEGRHVLFASPSQEQVDSFWDYAKKWLAPFIDSREIAKNENRRILEIKSNGGRIRAKTASNADTLRGDYADFLVLDECAMLEENAWNEVGAPMLMDNDGDAWFLSTPKRRNWFYHKYLQARTEMEEASSEGRQPRWQYFHATSFDNPYLSADALREISKDLSEDAYLQEIMAVFLEGEGAVFRNIDAILSAPTSPDPLVHHAHQKVMGIDWGQVRDYTVFSTFCATCLQELSLVRFNHVEWEVAVSRLRSEVARWGVTRILAEQNNMSVLLEKLANEYRLPIYPFNTNSESKGALIRSLALGMERNELQLLPDIVARLELEAYESNTSRITGRTQYSAPKGMHDDTVMARALAHLCSIESRTIVLPSSVSYTELGQVAVMSEAGAPNYLMTEGPHGMEGLARSLAYNLNTGDPF